MRKAGAPPSAQAQAAPEFDAVHTAAVQTFQSSPEEKELLSKAVEQCDRISKLPPQLREVALAAFERFDYNQGDKVLTAGEPANCFYVVGRGSFNLTSPEVNEGRSSLGRYVAGQIIAERNLYILRQDSRSPFSIDCDSAGSLFALPKASFVAIRAAMEANPVGVTSASIAEALRELPACRSVSNEQLHSLSSDVEVVTCTPGMPILTDPKPSDRVLIVQSGSFTVGSVDSLSIEFTTGDIIGERDLANMASKLGHGDIKASCAVALLQIPAAHAALPDRMRWLANHTMVLKVLRLMEVFNTLNGEQLEQLVRVGRVRDFEKDEVISTATNAEPMLGPFRRPSFNPEKACLSVILSGTVSISRATNKDGDVKTELLGTLSAGEHLGGKNLVDPSAPRVTQAVAGDLTCLLQLDAEALGELLELVKHSLLRELANRRWVLENRGVVQMEDLENRALIGVGSFGRVKLVVHKPTGKPFALKILSKKQLVKNREVEHVRSELALTTTCSHELTLKLVAAFQDASNLYMVLEFVQGGEIYRLMNEGKLDVSNARYYAASVITALAYLSTLNCAHRDIKPENLMITSRGSLKVIDFGLCKVLTEGRAYTFCGTPDYMAKLRARSPTH